MSTEQNTPEQKKIINLYSAFGASLVLTFVPSMMVAGIASVFMIGVLIAAYIIRKKSETGSFAQSHTTFIIRTIYIGSSLAIVSMSAAAYYMLPIIDHSPLGPCVNELSNQGTDFMQNASTAEAMVYLQPCLDRFIALNKAILINAAVIAGAPILLYFFYRLSRGLMRATKGYRISKPKSWL